MGIIPGWPASPSGQIFWSTTLVLLSSFPIPFDSLHRPIPTDDHPVLGLTSWGEEGGRFVWTVDESAPAIAASLIPGRHRS